MSVRHVMCADFISIKFQVEAEAKLLVSSNSQSAGRVSQCICAYGCGEDALLKFKLGHQNYTNCQFNNFLQNEMKCGKFNWIETLKKKKNRWWEQKVALNIIYVAQYIHIHVNTMAVVPTLYVNLPESGRCPWCWNWQTHWLLLHCAVITTNSSVNVRF